MHYLLPEMSDLCKISWDMNNELYPDLEILLRFIVEVSEKNPYVYLDMRNADATLWSKLPEFLERLPDNVYVDMRGGYTKKDIYWERFPAVYNVYLEFDIRKDSKRKLLSICDYIEYPEVLLTVDFKHYGAIWSLYKKLLKRNGNIAAVGERGVTYTDHELRGIAAVHNHAPRHYPGRIVWEHELADAGTLIESGENSFRGWRCRAGQMRYHINKELDIHGAKCGINYIGSLAQVGALTFLSKPLNCPYLRCTEELDLSIEKWHPDLPTWGTKDIDHN